jgi:hypothetical protein
MDRAVALIFFHFFASAVFCETAEDGVGIKITFPSVNYSEWKKLAIVLLSRSCEQGDQIGRIFVFWALYYFRQFHEN